MLALKQEIRNEVVEEVAEVIKKVDISRPNEA